MKPELYIIECKSNLHVGSGDSNYGVIDKLIQRDTADQLPCIFSSSLKGAFREYFEEVVEEKISKGQKVLSDSIFGAGDNKGSNGQSKGSHIFQQAFLLSIPLRSNLKPYFNATAPFIIEQLIELANLFGYKFPVELEKELGHFSENFKPEDNIPIVFESTEGLEIEDFSVFVLESKTKLPELQKIHDCIKQQRHETLDQRLPPAHHCPQQIRQRQKREFVVRTGVAAPKRFYCLCG